MSLIGRRLNERFLASYIELDKNCCEKFGVSSGGVTEYINRLINARFAPGRDDVLPSLVKYRNLRNRMVHESGELEGQDEVTKQDVRWLQSFKSSVSRKRDPISLYLRKARSYVRMRGFIRVLAIVGAVLIVGGIIALWLALK